MGCRSRCCQHIYSDTLGHHNHNQNIPTIHNFKHGLKTQFSIQFGCDLYIYFLFHAIKRKTCQPVFGLVGVENETCRGDCVKRGVSPKDTHACSLWPTYGAHRSDMGGVWHCNHLLSVPREWLLLHVSWTHKCIYILKKHTYSKNTRTQRAKYIHWPPPHPLPTPPATFWWN